MVFGLEADIFLGQVEKWKIVCLHTQTLFLKKNPVEILPSFAKCDFSASRNRKGAEQKKTSKSAATQQKMCTGFITIDRN